MAGMLASSAMAVPLAVPSVPAAASMIVPVSGDCYAIGMQQAAQVGGQLARATPEVRGGQQVCVIVVLMPARDGQRPRRSEIVVPMG
jgi:predicted secreted Zn-dependent protease